ncbi:hypothetical protein [Laspinema olomoucense]|uniref:hypothetical protein n=1 Tax=Laspinema olomoucense TaxID=3231600 RepID=UPI003F494BCE
MVDADQDLPARWQSIRDRLIASDYPKAEYPRFASGRGVGLSTERSFFKAGGSLGDAE